MCRSALSIVLFSIFFSAGMSVAKDFKSPHKLEAGQTLSADVLNEIIESLSFSEKIPTRDDFLGNWSCKKSLIGNSRYIDLSSSNYSPIIEQELIQIINGTLTFTSDDNGKYYLSDTDPEVLHVLQHANENTVKIENQPYATANNTFFFRALEQDMDSNYQEMELMGTVNFRGENQFVLYQWGNIGGQIFIFSTVCNKTNIPPEIPVETTTSLSANSITISWNDRSEDETGFVVLRRDSLDGQWAEIATVDPVVSTGTTVSYTNTGLSSGTYWYRVKSVNASGKSLGSNVSKVDIQ